MDKRNSGGWKASLATVLKAHNGAKQDGSVASHATQDKRADVLFAGFRELRALGYKLDSVISFRGKHMKVLARAWEKRGLSPSTLQNNISVFRLFATWIGKSGMVERAEKYVSNGAAQRSSINNEDKSWTARGVDADAKIAEVTALDPRIGMQLELQRAFGLRAREAMQLRPHIADQGTFLLVNMGTKGGRDRVVPIDSPQKREVLDRAKSFATTKMSSTSDPRKSLAQAKNRYYSILRNCGISRSNGYTGHGLRHEYANIRYRTVSGNESPVRGGALAQHDRDSDRATRLIVAEELGHSRENITTHYLGR